jgi:NAD(P)-dependent dehydrogenase (short-subunit alcohol dehydrogenase family)
MSEDTGARRSRENGGMAIGRVLVAGAGGAVGEAIVRALLARGADVVGISRMRNRLETLAFGPGFTPVEGDAGSEEGAKSIVEQAGAVDAAVASIGGWWSGAALADLPATEFRRLMDDYITSHFCFAKAVLPQVKRYVFINGGAAFSPVRGSTPLSIGAAAQAMMARAFAMENPEVLVTSLAIETPVISRKLKSGPAEWLTGEDVGRYVAWLLENSNSYESGQVVRFRERSQIPNSGA